MPCASPRLPSEYENKIIFFVRRLPMSRAYLFLSLSLSLFPLNYFCYLSFLILPVPVGHSRHTNFVARFFRIYVYKREDLPALLRRHREPTPQPRQRLSSGQCGFSRLLVKRQNTRPDNCGDRTLVRLITLHYKCIKLESNYKRARDRAQVGEILQNDAK